MNRHYRTIYGYLIKENFISFLVAFAFFFFIFFVNQILLIAQEILANKVPVLDVIILLGFSLPQIVSYALPFAALVGALMALGRLSSDNEILALRSSGVSLGRIFMPLFLLSIILSGVAFLFGDYFLPLGYINQKVFYKELMKKNAGVELEPFSTNNLEDKIIITGDVKENVIHDLVIFDKTENNEKRVIMAGKASMRENQEQVGVISLRLTDVFTHTVKPGEPGNYEYLFAEEMIYNILLTKLLRDNQTQPGPREKSSVDLYADILVHREKLEERREKQKEKVDELYFKARQEALYSRTLGALSANRTEERIPQLRSYSQEILIEERRALNDARLRLYEMEFYRKFSQPLGCTVFLIFAFPVGLLSKKSGRLAGFAIGVIMSGVYWGLLFVAFRLGIGMVNPPVLPLWMPNLVVGGLGVIIYFLRFRQ